MVLQKEDFEILSKKGISEEKLANQLQMLREGFPYLKLKNAATIGDGITRVSAEMQQDAVNAWNQYTSTSHSIVKMVPASGAASRMFKNVFAFFNSGVKTPEDDFMKKFFEHITEFAFFPRLNSVAMEQYGKSVLTLLEEQKHKDVAGLLLNLPGLNYGKLPKALLQFHKTIGASRTPIEEHLAEGAQYAAMSDGRVAVHFTVSEEHLQLAKAKIEEVQKLLELKYGVKYDISFSLQKGSTDTVASDLNGNPYRENGRLFFRPGGHGALIENLNDLDADIVFLKNIDNVVPDERRDSTILFKKIIGGLLVKIKEIIDGYSAELAAGIPCREKLNEMVKFAQNTLCITEENADKMDDEKLAEYLFAKFNRPLRVCGMVPNEGEPGGGPFLVYNADGTVSPQILETSQIDVTNAQSKAMLDHATHFNPVDLVCAIKDYKGEKFNLPDYVDQSTGFISQKSREGVEIKALELPGLWNGAMAGWNTIFVEVPASTFNPVKTVNDLLRPAHQPV